MAFGALIGRLFPYDDLKATVVRFPMAVLCTVCLFLIAVLTIHDVIDFDEDIMGRLVLSLGCLYFWFGAVKLIAESQKLSVKAHLITATVVAGLLVYSIFYAGFWEMRLMFVLPALLLLIMVAPYLKGGDDLSFWFYNRKVWFGVAVSYIALFMCAGGLSVAIFAVQELFEIDFPDELFGDIWAFSCLILGPIYALSWVPDRFEFTDEDCTDPPGLKFIVNWISVPMVFVYLCILYAYFGKIVVTGDVPNGLLAYMITGFAGAGIVAYLLSWPLRETGTLQLRLFHRVFFPALLIPVGFHFYAIWERVSAYGLTEERYFILLSAVWFLLLAVSNVFQRIPIKAIPMMLAILLVFASFGPWGAISASGKSQLSRLETLLVDNGLLKDGKVVKTDDPEVISYEDRKSIGSILDYLCSSNRYLMIEPWFNVEEKKAWYCFGGHHLTKEVLGFDYVSQYHYEDDRSDRISINVWANPSYVRVLDGYDYFLRDAISYRVPCKGEDDKLDEACNDKILLRAELEENSRLVFRRGDDIVLVQDITDFALKHNGRNDKGTPIFLDVENDNVSVRLDIHGIYGEVKDGKPRINSVNFDLYYRFKGE